MAKPKQGNDAIGRYLPWNGAARLVLGILHCQSLSTMDDLVLYNLDGSQLSLSGQPISICQIQVYEMVCLTLANY